MAVQPPVFSLSFTVIHMHGAPLTPEHAAAEVYRNRHSMVSYAHPEQLGLLLTICKSVCIDNGAFSFWKSGNPTDWDKFYLWLEGFMRHPAFDWFVIPDVIEGSEEKNDELIELCPHKGRGVPVWHLHESLSRLERLVFSHDRVALGSSGRFSAIGTDIWWARMDEAMHIACNEDGQPMCRLHGLRMLDWRIYTRFPFASADSTNCARNVGYDNRWRGTYAPPNKAARGIQLAGIIEAHQSPARYIRDEEEFVQGGLF